MTTFDYRVVFRNGEYAVHEVYFDDLGRPESCTVAAVSPSVSSIEGLRHELALMFKALDQPCLRDEDIGQSFPNK
ncbi:MAG: hypothetical protein IPI67_35790 [Myxococcales bacterium]|nr:hypothetical protein [Myxococcales bacterium]